MDWAAMRFIKDIVEQQQKKMKLEDLFLLILRCLLIIFITLALARPAFKNVDMNWLGGDGSALVLLDDSHSMDARAGALTRMERAKQRVQTLAQTAPENLGLSLSLGRRISLFPVSDYTTERALLLETIQNHTVSPWDASAEGMLRQGLKHLKQNTNPAKTLFVVSDFQKSQWDKPSASLTQLIEDVKEDINIVFIPVGDDSKSNVSVENLELISGISQRNQNTIFRVNVKNHDTENLQQRSLSLWVGEDMLIQKNVSIGPGQSTPVFFRHRFEDAGLFTASVRLEEDDQPIDNITHLGFRVQDKQPILIVHESEPREGDFTEMTFWEFALNPYEERHLDPRALYEVEHIDSLSLGSKVLSDYGYIVFNDVGVMSPEETESLEAYVKKGGGVVFFLGKNTNAEILNAVLHRDGEGPMRFPLKETALKAKKDGLLDWELKTKGHPIWFDLAGGQTDHLNAWNWYFCQPFERNESKGSLEFLQVGSEKECAAYEVSYGRGRVLFFGFGPGTQDHNLALTSAWPTFVGQVSAHLMETLKRDKVISFGDTWTTDLATSESQSTFRVKSPSDENSSMTAVEKDGEFELRLENVSECGVYRIQNMNQDEPPWQVSVTLPKGEGAIQTMTGGDLETLYADKGVVVDETPDLNIALSAMKAAPDFSFSLLILALLTLIAEQWLGHRIHKRGQA